MTDRNEKKIKGRAIVIKTDKKPPEAKDVRAMQALARRVSPEMLALLEAEPNRNG